MSKTGILKNKRVFTEAQKERLWEKYRSGDRDVVIELAEAYIPLIEIIASKYKHNSKLPSQVEVGDLITDGYFGLLDAIKKFDDSKGHKFETYAVARIRGSILDALRDYDPVSRYYRGKFKELNAAIDMLYEEFSREPTFTELSEVLNWNEEEVFKVQNMYYGSFSVNIDDFISQESHEKFSVLPFLVDEKIGDTEFHLEEQELASRLVAALSILNVQENAIIYMKHFCGKTFQEIGEIWGLKPPRLSRIYNSALEKLKNDLLK